MFLSPEIMLFWITELLCYSYSDCGDWKEVEEQTSMKASKKSADSLEDCKNKCVEDYPACVAVSYLNNKCRMHWSDTYSPYDNARGSTHYQYKCELYRNHTNMR